MYIELDLFSQEEIREKFYKCQSTYNFHLAPAEKQKRLSAMRGKSAPPLEIKVKKFHQEVEEKFFRLYLIFKNKY